LIEARLVCSTEPKGKIVKKKKLKPKTTARREINSQESVESVWRRKTTFDMKDLWKNRF